MFADEARGKKSNKMFIFEPSSTSDNVLRK